MPNSGSSMTHRYLVMPRGINVGRHNRVSMPQLRTKLAAAGYSDVATVLQSGNVIVSSETGCPDQVAEDVAGLLGEEFDVKVPCLVRTTDQILEILRRDPLQEVVTDPSRYLVYFLSEAPDPHQVKALLEEGHGPEVIVVEGSEAYIWAPHGMKALTLTHAYLQKRFGVVATARNWNTLAKIAAKF